MKRLQRRAKSRNSIAEPSKLIKDNALLGRFSHYRNTLSSRWHALPSRDQLALTVLSVFLLVFVGGYGGYSMHQAATDSKNAYQAQVADYFWLRAQAGNIDSQALTASAAPDGAAAMPPASRVSTLLDHSGIANAQVVAAGDAVQLSFDHASQAVVSGALAKLQQQGWQFTQLSMQQDLTSQLIQVQATIAQ
ncbi:type II secretion system protein GspM [Psychrobacter celer]|uniref:type II secretion system protein GspM n=1 Tax=Psychrobacter celer TaxID=306572 RepID=UPI0018E0628B|nr:type II secretion system protein GspM [Psychrobacter celer]